jgi:hypothetical protein
MGKRRVACGILVARHKGKRPLGRPRRKWEGNIKMKFSAVEWKSWTDLAQDRNRCPAVLITVMNLSAAQIQGNS